MSASSLPQRALALFDDLVELEPAARAHRLAELAAADPALHAELLALLEADAASVVVDRSPASLLGGDAWTDEEPGSLLGTRVGPWRVVAVLGRGGMGAVYRGERDEGGFQQQAALKLIRMGLDRPELRRRFGRERQILARLRHPNIAALLDGGVAEGGAPYFAMELVDGEPIDRWCDARGLGLRERVRLFLQVCGAVQHAHRNLTVHRDLKPGNILVTAEGQAKLLDFGIAKLLEGDTDGVEATRDRPFTPEFAAPEQVRGEAVTTATDVYALGVVLYGLLAGTHPSRTARGAFAGGEPPPLARAAAESGDAGAAARGLAPRALAAALRGDLDAIVQRCLREDPLQRYPSVEALAGDLAAWLDGRSVEAAHGDRFYRLRKFVARNRVACALGVVALLAIVGGVGATLWQSHNARAQARLALAAQQRSEVALRRATATSDLLLDLFRVGTAAGAHDRPPSTEELLADAVRQAPVRFRDDPETQAQFLDTMAQVHAERGEPDGPIREQVLALRAARRGQDPVAYAVAQEKLAWSRTRSDRLEESERLFAEAIATLQARAPGSLELARAHADRTLLHQVRFDGKAFVGDAKRAWDILAVHPGASDSEKFEAQMRLAFGYRLDNDHAQSLRHLDRALALSAGMPPQDPALALLLTTRAADLARLGRFASAEQAWKDLARRFASDAGPADVHALSAWKGLEQLYYRTGRYAEANEAGRVADRLRTAAADSGYRGVSLARSALLRARNETGLGHYRRADALLREAFAGIAGSPAAASWADRLLLTAYLGRARNACLDPDGVPVADDIARGFELLHAAPGPDTRADLEGVAGLCRLRAGDPAGALARLDAALAIPLPPGDGPFVAERQLWRGQALAALGRPDEARAAWRDGQATLRALDLPGHPLHPQLARALAVAGTPAPRER